MFFSKKKTIETTNFFENFVDYHCHILPGVDDGVKTMDDSLEILKRYEQLGVSEVWLTPHVMEDIPNTTEKLKERFEELTEAYLKVAETETRKPLVLHLAAEYMLDDGFEEKLKEKDLLTLGTYDQVLVETSYYNPPMRMVEILNDIKGKGYYPVLAHPERYMYMDKKDYKLLKDMGIRFQLNLGSLSNGYGHIVTKKAKDMLKQNYYQYYGTDCHRMSMIDMILKAELPKAFNIL
ncbi:MAG: capsular biosynthesis protein [Prevotellaceae bacterium]|nr:capsular biosynthesis protein [Prevotellaceae bacterium]